MFLQILKITAAVTTIATGLISLIWPLRVPGFTGLDPQGGRGISEIRTILGALFIGFGAAVIYFNLPQTYAVLGITYLVMALVRGVSILIDKAPDNSNIISFGVELILGIILVL